MARSINQLSPRGVSTKTKRGRYADGGGLYLQVSGNGAQSWLFRFMLNGKSRQMGLGSLHTISLAEARDEALEDQSPRPPRVWNRIPDDVRQRIVDLALDVPELSPRELAVRFTDTENYFVSEASVYRLLKSLDHDRDFTGPE